MKLEAIRKSLKSRTVGIAGCGGLGSNCAVALARSGIGKLILVDFDKVEESNLNRQYFFHDQLGQPKSMALKESIHRIDQSIDIDSQIIKLDPTSVVDLFSSCDVIVEAFDSDHEKQMIIETVLDKFPDKYIISGQGLAGYGNNDSIRTQRLGNLFVIGDGMIAVSEEHPPLGPRVAVVAGMQANLVLEILLNEDQYGNNTE